MNHVAQEHPNCESSSTSFMPWWLFWNVLFFGGLVIGLEVSGYSVINAVKSVL